MTRLLFRSSARYLARHPWQLALAVLGIALGVGVAVAVHLTQYSARIAFDLATRSVVGNASHQIAASAGGIDEGLYRAIKVAFHDLSPAPVVEATVALPDRAGYTLRLVGIDPVRERDVRGTWDGGARAFEPARLMTQPGGTVVNDRTAARLGLTAGASITVRAGAAAGALSVIGIVPAARAGAPHGLADDVLLVDIATAQEVLGAGGRLSRIDLRVPPGPAGQARLQRVRALLPRGSELVNTGTETRAVRQMTSAFYTNLTALSLLALLVGMFLIHNTETFLVIQRRALTGRLRALGVTRGEVLAVILAEACVIGGVGSLVGLAAGIGLARVLIRLVAQTLNDLYFAVSVTTVELAPAVLTGGLLLGIGATVVAALPAALEAANTAPARALQRSALEYRFEQRRGRRARLGAGLVALSVVAMAIPSQNIIFGFALLCLLVAGFALLTPALTVTLIGALGRVPLVFRGVPRRLALRSAAAALSRTAVATTALMIATAASIAIGIMIASFRGSVSDWLDTLLRADVYISDTAGEHVFGTAPIDTSILQRLDALPEVATLSTVRRIDVHAGGARARLVAYELPAEARPGFEFVRGDRAAVWARWTREDVVVVSEPYARHGGLAVGDILSLTTADGAHPFEIIAVYRDYSSEHGLVALSRATFDRHWHDLRYDGVGVYGAAGVDAGALMRALRAALADQPMLALRSNAELKEHSLSIFDRTFAITGVLRWLAVIVAFIGILGSLLALQLERTHEFGVLRALGFSDREMFELVMSHTGVIGCTAGLLALPAGIAMAMVLIFVINLRSFGWTMTPDVAPGLLLQAWLLAVLAALLAGVLPAVRAARMPPAAALRYE